MTTTRKGVEFRVEVNGTYPIQLVAVKGNDVEFMLRLCSDCYTRQGMPYIVFGLESTGALEHEWWSEFYMMGRTTRAPHLSDAQRLEKLGPVVEALNKHTISASDRCRSWLTRLVHHELREIISRNEETETIQVQAMVMLLSLPGMANLQTLLSFSHMCLERLTGLFNKLKSLPLDDLVAFGVNAP